MSGRASLFLGALGLTAAQQFELKYWDDANCTQLFNDTVGGLGQYAVSGPLDTCINMTAIGSPLKSSFQAMTAVNCNADNFTMHIEVGGVAKCPASVGGTYMAGNNNIGGCHASGALSGKYYSADCSTSNVWPADTANSRLTWTITTTVAPFSSGQFSIQYYNDVLCSDAWNVSGVDVALSGPMNTCWNVTSTGSPLAASYKVADVGDCKGSIYSMAINVAHECPATMAAIMPVYAGACTYSSSFSKYYMAACSATAWAGATTHTIATTHAPIAAGSFDIKYYNDNACTSQWNVSGADVELSGPMGSCVNVTATGSPLAATYKAAKISACNGQAYTMSIQTTHECPASGMAADMPVAVGTCTWSSSFSKYYMATCSASAWSGATTFVITTTHAPISAGSFDIKYYNDNACSTQWNVSGADVELAGPMGSCVNVTATGSPLAATYAAASISDCNGGSYQMGINTAHTCPTSGMAGTFPVTVGVCTWSTSFSKYYMGSCSNSSWSGSTSFVIPVSTTTAAPTTLAATTVASSGNGTSAATTVASSGNGTTTGASSGSNDASNEGNGTTAAPTTTAAPVTVQASYEATEVLPDSITPTQLLASTPYVTAKKLGLAGALSVASSKVTITEFAISRRRLSESKRQLTSSSKTVTTKYEVEVAAAAATAMETTVASNAIVASIQSETETAMAAQDWSAEPVLTGAPNMTVSAVAYVGTVTVAPVAVPTSSMAFGTVVPVAASLVAAITLLF